MVYTGATSRLPRQIVRRLPRRFSIVTAFHSPLRVDQLELTVFHRQQSDVRRTVGSRRPMPSRRLTIFAGAAVTRNKT